MHGCKESNLIIIFLCPGLEVGLSRLTTNLLERCDLQLIVTCLAQFT